MSEKIEVVCWESYSKALEKEIKKLEKKLAVETQSARDFNELHSEISFRYINLLHDYEIMKDEMIQDDEIIMVLKKRLELVREAIEIDDYPIDCSKGEEE